MRIIRPIGNIALWLGALLGIAAGFLYLAGVVGWAQPLIVISGSMEPVIRTGDLLVATKADSADLEVGDVVSLPSDLTQKLVTHRITEIEPADDGGWKIYMKGDANEFEDIAPYYVGDEVWQPALQIPHVGFVVSKLMQPSVSLPIVIALGALLGMSLLDGKPRDDEQDDDEEIHETSLDGDDDTDPFERPADIPLPTIGGGLLLGPGYVEADLTPSRRISRVRVRPGDGERTVNDHDALAEIDEALAALGIHVGEPLVADSDSTTALERDPFESDLFDLISIG